MPMLEVFYSGDHPPTREQKRAFAAAASTIFQRVIGTSPGRLQLMIRVLEREDTLAILDDREEEEE
ncbi:tautomerase family protein [Chloroflexus sp.]|uniref:tautomerase family protein n=1 Tax=Chloroflexus sp. TaxID=1904827 RepID=UPI003C70D6F7